MALIECPECRKQMSDKATACPECGCPIEQVHISKVCEASACTGCGKQLLHSLPMCGICDALNPNYDENISKYARLNSDQCWQCGSVVTDSDAIRCSACGVGAPLSRPVLKVSSCSKEKSNNDISQCNEKHVIDVGIKNEACSVVQSRNKTLIYILIIAELIAVIIYAKFSYDILQSNGDRKYLYRTFGSQYPLFLFAPLAFGAISVIGKSFKIYEVFTTLLFGFGSIGWLVYVTKPEYYTPRALIVGVLVATSFFLIATKRDALVGKDGIEKAADGASGVGVVTERD